MQKIIKKTHNQIPIRLLSKNTTRKYFGPHLNVSKMYDAYKEEHEKQLVMSLITKYLMKISI